MKKLKIILGVITLAVLMVVLLMVVGANNQEVTVDYMFDTFTWPLYWVINAAIGLGVLLGLFGMIIMKISMSLHKRKAKHEVDRMKKKINELEASSRAA